MEPKRLNKFISDSGFCSRREADRLIEEERVTVNGKLPAPGTQVTAKDKVRIDDQMLRVREEAPVFLIFNKPAGMSAKSDPSVRDNVVRAINYPATLEPIGYLDRDGEGLLFLSNDADLVRKINRADNKFEKEYIVTVDKLITQDFISKMIGGGETEKGEKLQRTFIEKVGSTRFKIILTPAANHNIKMLCEDLGYRVVHLQRTRIQNFTLTKLPTGHWRALNPSEVASLRETAAGKISQEELIKGRSPERPGSGKASSRKDSSRSGSDSKRFDKATSKPREGKSRPKPTGSAPKSAGSRNTRISAKSSVRSNSAGRSSKRRTS